MGLGEKLMNVTRFSTDDLPERDRVAVWCDGFANAALQATFNPVVGRPFRQVGAFYVFDNLGVTFGETNGFLARRDKRQLADSNDDLLLNVNLLGCSLMSQRGRELRLGSAEAVLLTCGEVLSNHVPEPMRGFTLRIPRLVLANLIADPESALMRPVAALNPALRLLTDYVGLLARDHQLSSPELQRAFVTHVHDLVALVLGAAGDATAVARSQGLRAARLNAIRTDIVDHIGDQELSVTEIARRHRVTPRYVQMLFEAAGETFTEFVIQQRLALAHRRLTDSRFAEQLKISAIAFEVGFDNLSYFNRVFRQRYGASPSQVRETARRERGG
jgi:AraC-like DNA-binding protein